MQEYNKKLAYQRDNEDNLETMVDEEEREDHVRTPEVSPNKDAGPMKLEKVIRGPGALPSLASPSAIVRNNRSESKSPSTVISRSSSFQDNPLNENDYPPMPRPKIGERHQPCAICTMPIDLSTLTESAWKYVITSLNY